MIVDAVSSLISLLLFHTTVLLSSLLGLGWSKRFQIRMKDTDSNLD